MTNNLPRLNRKLNLYKYLAITNLKLFNKPRQMYHTYLIICNCNIPI